jgi:hypothetical protein
MTRRDEILFELLSAIDAKLGLLVQLLGPPGPAKYAEIIEIIDGREVKVGKMEAVKGGAKKLLKVKFYDETKKNEAPVDGAPKWVCNVENAVALKPSEDGMSCEVEFLKEAPVGILKIQVIADPDMSENVKELVGEKEYQVVSGEAVFVEISSEDVA